ncbi:hypothetical protein YC2023_017951 [Brassica napus]
MFGEMHPPDLKMLETNSGVRGSGGSFRGKSQASSSNTTEGNSRSHVVVMAGRWIMYDNGGWDFKIDNERMGRAVDFSQIKGVNGLKDSILASYGLLGRDLEVEMRYWLIDGESEMVGKGAAPVEIATDTDYKIFKALPRTDKQVEAVEASFGLNSQTAEGVQGSKDKDSGAAVDGVNPASGNMLQQEKQKSCALGTVVENGSKKRAHVEAAEDAVCGVNLDNMHQQNCHGGRSGRNGYERSVVTRVRGQGSRRGQRSRATGGSLSGKQCCNMRNYEDNTDNLRDFVCTSQIVDFSYTEDSDICGSVDVVNVTQPKDRKQQNHDDDFVDRRFTKSSSETVRCALTFATGNANVGNVVLVTPPQRNEKRSHVIEDDDEYFDPTLGQANPPEKHNTHSRVIEDEDPFVDPPVRISSQVQGGEAFMKGIQVSEMEGQALKENLEPPIMRRPRGKRRSRTSVSGVLRKVTRRLHARNRCLDQSNEEHDSMELGGTLL